MKLPQHNIHVAKRAFACLMLTGCLCWPLVVLAQEPAGAGTTKTSLPDSPQPQANANPTEGTTTRFIGYMTNQSLIFPDIAFSEGPLTTGKKFRLFVNQSISPPYILAAGISAAYEQARNSPKAYGQGWDAYASRFGVDVARATSNSFFSSFVLATVLHEDPRFFPQYRPSLWGSVKYSAQRVFITRTDAGFDRFNSSGVFGTAAAEGLANVYLPASEQTAARNCERVGTDLAWKFGGNMFKNYWPTLFRSLGLNRLKVIPDPGSVQHPAPNN
jgi:hypothetical protein